MKYLSKQLSINLQEWVSRIKNKNKMTYNLAKCQMRQKKKNSILMSHNNATVIIIL